MDKEHALGSNLIEQAVERLRQTLAKQPAADGDRRFDLACYVVAGVAASSYQANPTDIALRAVEIVDATLKALKPR